LPYWYEWIFPAPVVFQNTLPVPVWPAPWLIFPRLPVSQPSSSQDWSTKHPIASEWWYSL